jgi:hypothetical protein
MFSGVKTNYETLGFDNSIVNDDPYSELEATKVETILKWAQDAGMDTGQLHVAFCELNLKYFEIYFVRNSL